MIEQQRPRSGYLPSLDGWRALAVLGVMATHDRPIVLWGHSLRPWMGRGGYGVYLFFAISGFLITTRILEECDLVGKFHIGRFYVRRILRIQPASLLYLAVVALMIVGGTDMETWRQWFSALGLYVNFLWRPGEPPTLTPHFWTLAVEEHFYILLSLTLLVMRRNRLLALFGLYLLFTLPLVLTFGIRHHWYDPTLAPRSTQWQLSPLFAAALCAGLVRRPWVERAVRVVLKPWVGIPLSLLLVIANQFMRQSWFHLRSHDFRFWQWGLRMNDTESTIAQLFTATVVLWIVSTVFHPESLTTRTLETAPLRFLGKISYSLYLWHGLIFHFWFTLGGPFGAWREAAQEHLAYWWLERPVRYGLAIGVATLSYRFVEKPLMRLGHRLAPPATPGRLEFADLPRETAFGDVPANTPG